MEKNAIAENKVVAIVRGVSGLKLLRLAEALMDGGIKIMEVSFQDDNLSVADSIAQLVRLTTGRMTIGAGTVLSVEQVGYAARAGAEFIISPNADEEVISATKKAGLISVAGALTPTEVAAAIKAGADYVKIFPAGAFGPDYVKALKAPFVSARFLAASGVNCENAGDYIRAGYSAVGVSAILQEASVIDKGDFGEITERAAALVASVNA